LEGRDSVIVAFVIGVAAGSVWSALRRMDRWSAVDIDRVDEGRDALMNHFDDRVEGLVNVITTRFDDIATLMGARGRCGVTTLPPRDG